MLSAAFVLVGYAALPAIFGWWGAAAVLAHIALLVLPIAWRARRKG